MPALIRRRDPDRADCWRIRPLWVIFDRVQRGLSIGSFRFAPRADIPGSASVYEYTPFCNGPDDVKPPE
jgi:hypothetical protein